MKDKAIEVTKEAVNDLITNEQLIQTFKGLLMDLVKGLKTAANFTIEQVPLVVQEYMRYIFATSLVLFILGFVIPVVIVLFWKWWINHDTEHWSGDSEILVNIFSTVFSVIGGICSIALILTNTAWFKIWIAPKVWIIEEAIRLYGIIK